MASSAASMRHSFVDATSARRDDERRKLSRNASLPSGNQVKNGNADKSKTSDKKKKRGSGLFESSESSGSESASDDHDERVGLSGLPRPAGHHNGGSGRADSLFEQHAPTRHFPLASDRANSGQERKGLFELDDDADSVETLRERVKLRQKKKESEILTIKLELDKAMERIGVLEENLGAERKEKDEFAIRLNECQRIIEKRNKQLIKASEKMARYTEHSENQVAELQKRVEELTVGLETAQKNVKATQEQQDRVYEARLLEQRNQFEGQIERLTELSAETLREHNAEESALRARIKQLEEEVVTSTAQIVKSEEYQYLLRRYEDAEAISRGLKFQLEKAHQEKKTLQKQLAAQGSNGLSKSTYSAANALFVEVPKSAETVPNISPASSAASNDLSNFDFYPPHTPVPGSPVGSPSLRRRSWSEIKPPSSPYRKREEDAPVKQEDKSAKFESNEPSIFGNAYDDEDQEPPPPPAEATPAGEKPRPHSGSINFFEKLSIKFKRGSSPRTSLNVKTSETEKPTVQGAPTQGGPSSGVTSPMNMSTGQGAVLKNRPKMYVAKGPSDDEESSDSIFGSDSDEDDSSSDGDDQPPPPPPQDSVRSPVEQPSPPPIPVTVTAPPPPLFGNASDADSSSNSSEDEQPRQSPSVAAQQSSSRSPSNRPSPESRRRTTSRKEESSSSSSDDGEKREKQRPRPKKHSSRSEKRTTLIASSSESSESEKSDDSTGRRRRVATDDGSIAGSSIDPILQSQKRNRSRSSEGDTSGAHASSKVSRMNEYMEARARKRQEKIKKKEERETAEHKKREDYEKEWEKMAEEERERRRKQQQQRRTGRRRPSSMKTVRVSQMRQKLSKNQQRDQQPGVPESTQVRSDDGEQGEPQKKRRQQSEHHVSESESSNDSDEAPSGPEPPLPPEPTAADTELYMRQQARLRERHELEMKKKLDAEEADQVRGQIHRRVEMWAFRKEFLHMILTLDQITTNDTLRQCQLTVVQSPDNDTLRKAYRNIIRVIHPDKLRGASIPEQLEAKELFTVLNQAFEKFKNQAS